MSTGEPADPSLCVRKLALGAGFRAPRELRFEDLLATPLSRHHLADDLRAVNESVELIQRTRGGDWPAGPVTEEFDYLDLAWHEREFREGDSFSYAVFSDGDAYIGCFYLYPMGLRTPITAELAGRDVDASWWVTPSAYERGYYLTLYRALGRWLSGEFPFQAPYYSNAEIPPRSAVEKAAR